jgi:hydrogenase expression/formation protein HypD
MKHAHEFRDAGLAKGVLARLQHLCAQTKATKDEPLHIMEICGGHTHSIYRYGLQDMVPKEIEFIHGPGCPVCVLPMGRVDDCIEIAEHPNVILTTFGDAMRVPGTRKSLLQAKADGADIRIVYSPLDALAIARKNSGRDVVFFGLGFETTMPSTALTVLQAAREGISNFFLFCNHITVPAPVKALLDDPDLRLDGFVGPGHVSMVIGTRPYEFITNDYHKPIVVSGFEPLDILQSVAMTVAQIVEGRAEIENQYGRVAPRDGNPVALTAIETVFEPRERFEWRGLGVIDSSGVRMRPAFSAFDAEVKFGVGYGKGRETSDPFGCRCGDVLKGLIKPHQCELFDKVCNPETPMGALMVSSEGACAAYHQYAGARAREDKSVRTQQRS